MARLSNPAPSVGGETPTTIAVGDSAGEGSSGSAARADHTHGMAGFGAVAGPAAFGDAAANGSGTTLARSDHVHGLPTPDLTLLAEVSGASGVDTIDSGVFSTAFEHLMVMFQYQQITAENACSLALNADSGQNYGSRIPNWETSWAEAGASNTARMTLISIPVGYRVHGVLYVSKQSGKAAHVTGLVTAWHATADTGPDRVQVVNGFWNNTADALDQVSLHMANAYMDDYRMQVYGLH